MSAGLVQAVEAYIAEIYPHTSSMPDYLLPTIFERCRQLRHAAAAGDGVTVKLAGELLKAEAEFEAHYRQKYLNGDGPKQGTRLC